MHVRAGAFQGRLPQLAGEHPRLVHLAPTLVGAPHPGLVLPAVRRDDRHRGGDARPPARSAAAPVEQDPDVLDTWFSLRALAVLARSAGRTTRTTCARFYPSSVMETGYDILFFWVARMVFFGLEIMGEPPFHTVYLHGTVRDVEGAKMSKTKGNVHRPDRVTADYGADALRFALVTQGSPGADMTLSCSGSKRAATSPTSSGTRRASSCADRRSQAIACDADGPARARRGDLALADRWILSRLDATIARSTACWQAISTAKRARRSATSSGRNCATGTSRRPRSGCGRRTRSGRRSRRRSPTCSSGRCGCCIRSCRSSPRRSGSNCRTPATS